MINDAGLFVPFPSDLVPPHVEAVYDPLHRAGGSDVSIPTALDVSSPEFTVSRCGLVVRGEPTFEQWLNFGATLRSIHKAVQWAIGDWINYGEHTYGEVYAQALEQTEYDYQTLADFAWVARSVEFSLRKENLRFSHHKEVAALEPHRQAALLIKAETEKLTVQELRAEVRGTPDIISPSKHKPKTNRAGDEYVPQGFDACQTPGYAIDPLCPYLNAAWTIWEPASGEGLLAEALYDCGIHEENVIRTDILTGQNFFEYLPSKEWDCLITNPPYSIKYPWIERCYEIGKPFALLLPVETLGAKTAQVFFRDKGVEVIFLDSRINFKMPNIGWDGSAAQFPTAWFTWGMNIGQQMTFAELKRGD